MSEKLQENKQDNKKKFYSNNLVYALCLITIIAMVGFATWSSTQKEVSHEQYLSRLTPDERQELQHQQQLQAEAKTEQDRISEERTSKEFKDFLVNPVLSLLWAVVIFILGVITGNSIRRMLE